MTTDAVFSASGLLALPFWVAMITLPGWRWTQRVMASPLIVAGAAALYAVLVLPRAAQILPIVANPSLAAVATLLGSTDGATIAWVHFLAFDLFVGRWIFLDSRARGLHPLMVGPLLALTLLLGPLGLLTYFGLRSYVRLTDTLPPAARRVLAVNPLLGFVAVASSLLFVGTLAGLAIDPRVITGAPAWLKPMKFAISIAIYAVTFLWLLQQVRGHPRLVRLSGSLTALAAIVELVIIVTQVMRNTTSHFNVSTPLDGTLFGIMGGSIVILWLMSLLAGVLLLRQQFADPAFAWSLRLAVCLSLVGMAVAFLMTNPSAGQRAAIAADATLATVGAHSVGVADGGPGLPILGWSTVAGDLRAPHFVGLHALQVMSLIGWLLSRPGVSPRANRRALDAGHRTALVWTAGLSYLGVIVVLTWQALRGQSIIAWDGFMLAAVVTLAATALVASIGVILHARRTPRRSAAAAAPAL